MKKVIVVVIVVVIFFMAVNYFRVNRSHTIAQKAEQIYSDDQLNERYQYLLTHVTKTIIHPYLRPVHFSIGKYFAACGTLVLSRDSKPQYIITAAHLFSETQPGSDYYDYHVLSSNGYTENGHISKVVVDSIRRSNNIDGIEDVAVCYFGLPELITRNSKVRISASTSFQGIYKEGKMDDLFVTSITTGEKYKVAGQLVNDQDKALFATLYESTNGESGSGFWGSDNNFYILSGSVDVTDGIRKDLDIPPEYKRMSILTRVGIHF
jgi:secreted trypsin-like serine protease